MTALAMLFTVASGVAAIDCSYFVTQGNGSAPPLKLAVAANFFGPSKVMVANFLAANPNLDITINICSGATGDFALALTSNPTAYDMFFAADNTAANFNNDDDAYYAYPYARGIPVLFGYTANGIPNVGSLLTGLSTPGNLFATLSGTNLSAYSIATATANNVAYANPGVAPYGVAAVYIMTALYKPPTPTLNMQPDVGAAFSAVGTGSTHSGFVAKSQICTGGAVPPSIAYVEFPDFGPLQYVVQLTDAATDLNDYITTQMTLSGWNTFLTSNCYVAP